MEPCLDPERSWSSIKGKAIKTYHRYKYFIIVFGLDWTVFKSLLPKGRVGVKERQNGAFIQGIPLKILIEKYFV
jgi:hypothetical protein